MGINLKWDITNKCNLNCKHCINGNALGHMEGELTEKEVESVISKLDSSYIEGVHLLGGEPTARQDLIHILETFKKQKVKVGFNTNGLKLSNDQFLNAIIQNEYINNIVFSVEGPNAEINDFIRGKNVFDIIIKSIRNTVRLKKELEMSGLRITVNTVLSKLNMNYIGEMIDFCIELGVDEFVILQFIADGNAKENDFSIDFQDELEVVKVVANKYASVREKLNIVPRFTRPLATKYCNEVLKLEFPEVIHGCGAGSNFAYMNNKGEVFPCDRSTDAIKSLNKASNLSMVENDFYTIWGLEGFDDLYSKTEGKSFYKAIKPCNQCEYLQSKCYPCPISIESNDISAMVHCEKYLSLLV